MNPLKPIKSTDILKLYDLNEEVTLEQLMHDYYITHPNNRRIIKLLIDEIKNNYTITAFKFKISELVYNHYSRKSALLRYFATFIILPIILVIIFIRLIVYVVQL